MVRFSGLCMILAVAASTGSVGAFCPSATTTSWGSSTGSTSLSATKKETEGSKEFWHNAQQDLKSTVAAVALAGALWASPASLASQSSPTMDHSNGNPTVSMLSQMGSASAKEMASGSGARVNKDAESLLRYGLPIKNKEVRKLQIVIEDIKNDIGSKRKAAALDGVKKARNMLQKDQKAMSASCVDGSECDKVMASMKEGLDPLETALKASQDAFTGSEQERDALDQAYKSQVGIAKQLTTLEEQMVPLGYETPVSDDYSDLPRLKARATVEMTMKRPGDEPFNVQGTNFKEVKMTMIIDGYGSPITGGNFVDLVRRGFYDNMKIQRSDGFVVQTGDPDGEADGFVGKPNKSVGGGKHGERLIPLEIFIKGDKQPIYETSIEDEGRGGEATILPFSSYGAMGWARDEYEANSGSSQFFWLLFDSDLTPAGKNVLDGRYPCFGYVVEGADFLSAIQEGDVITSAKVTAGLEGLVQPKE